MKKYPCLSMLIFLQFLPVPVHAGLLAELAKGVAINVISKVITSAMKAPSEGTLQVPRTEPGSVDDKRRVEAIIKALIDTTIPLEERIGLYATRVDYYSSGVVDHAYIQKDREYFEHRWPARQYRIVAIDEIDVDLDKKFAAARYTVEYVVERPGQRKSGTSQMVVLLGSFDSQPRIYAVKEWVHRD